MTTSRGPVPRAARPRSRAAAALTVWIGAGTPCGCADAGGKDAAGMSATEGGDTGEPAPPPPRFLQPANTPLALSTHRAEDLQIEVADVDVGLTRIWIDGVDRGTWVESSPLGVLANGALTLRMQGALVVGTHRLQLVTPASGGDRRSAELLLDVRPSAPVSLSVGDPEPVVVPGAPAVALASFGHADRTVAALVHADGDTVHLLPARGNSWDLPRLAALELPGLAGDAVGSQPRLALALTELPAQADGGAITPYVATAAWIPALAPTRVERAVVRWYDGPPQLDPAGPSPWFDAAALAPAAEARRFVALGQLGTTTFAILEAPLDADSPRASDRQLAYRVGDADDPSDAGPAALARFDAVVGLDLLGESFDVLTAARGPSPLMLARAGGLSPVWLERDPLGAPRPRPLAIAGGLPQVLLDADRLGGSASALGSHYLWLERRGAIRALAIDASGTAGAVEVSPRRQDLPLRATELGPPALVVIAGAPVLLVPYGDADDVRAVVLGDVEARVQPLPPLRCDALAAPATVIGNGARALDVLCLRGGELTLVPLRAP